MNHAGVLQLGGPIQHRNLPSNGSYSMSSLGMNPHYSTPHRYYQPPGKPHVQFMPPASQLDTMQLAPPNYYDISLTQSANQIRVQHHMTPELQDCKPFKTTHRHNSGQQLSCEPLSATHSDTKSRIERRITELNTQLQSAPKDPGSPWWDELADTFFQHHSTILVLLPQSGSSDTKQSRFHLEKTPLAALEFFKNLYEHQVSQVVISLKGSLTVSENVWTGDIKAQAPEAVLFTEHHHPQSVKVTTEGHMSITFTPQLKIRHLEFDIKSATEFVARKNFQNLNKSGLQEMRANSTCYGIHNETIEFLKMTRVLESMQAMMAQHKSKNSIPQEIETSGTHSTQDEDTPAPLPATKPTHTARHHSNYKNSKNARKNRKRKLNTDWNTSKKPRAGDKYELVSQAEVEVIRHHPERSVRAIYTMGRISHSNGRHSGMYNKSLTSNQLLL